MIAAAADTNVLASGFLGRNPEAAPVRILDAWRAGAFTLVVSEYVLEELARTLARPYFVARLGPEQAAANFRLLRADARLALLDADVRGVATHPEDDLILATALSGQADYLVTGDRQFQQLGAYRTVSIVSPRAFLNLLDAQGS